jgi:hypothetical protein
MGNLLVIGLKGVREVEEPESEGRTGRHGVEEGFVESKVCLFCANATGKPHDLLGSEGVHLEAFGGKSGWVKSSWMGEFFNRRHHEG